MIRTGKIAEVKKYVREWKRQGLTIGLVPTMGYLHEGHASLIRRAREDNDRVIVSDFVNPIQFGPKEDLAVYPRDFEADCKLCDSLGADLIFHPEPDEMYAPDACTHVKVDNLTDNLCGVTRPFHFQGVCTVVSKLFHISEADRAEALGDGCDSRLRLRSEAQDAARQGPSADGEDADLDKGDSAAGGSGDNSERQGDMSGSLASQEVKPSGSAGTNGREDRGRSSSVGRSGNHGQSGATATTSDTVSAAQKAASGGPESLREVLGTGWGAHRGFALSAAETDAMLATAAQALTRERALEQQLHVAGPRAARLDAGERQGLAERYAGLTFTETYITPGGGRLPPAFAERAKALHHRLDKLLRQQRERSASQRTGALSQRELWKVPLDAKDVFRRKAPPSKRETAFYLLIDRSGSMGAGIGDGNSKLFTALATAAVLEEALKGIAYTKIVAFDGGTNAVEHCVIKDFDQKEIGSRCIDAMTQIAAGNGNKDGYSIRAAALDLAKRTERRKILMVLSDGLPSGYFSEAEAIDDVRTAVQAARRRGLLVIPIIYTARTDENVDAYRRMYEKSMIFADSVGMLGEFERLLMKLVR